MNRTTRALLGWALAILVTLLFAGVNLLGWRQVWGLSFYVYLPRFWTFVALGLILVAFLPAASDGLVRACERLSASMRQSTRRSYVAMALTAIGLGVLFWYLNEQLPLLGDGGLRAREIYDGKLWKTTEFGDVLLHAALYRTLLAPSGYKVTETYHIISVLAGLVFMFGTFRLAMELNLKRIALWTVAVLSTGCTVLFFGYVESYSVVAALFPWVLWSGLKAVDRRGSTAFFAIWVLAAGCIHTVAFILFGPALLMMNCIRAESCVTWIAGHRRLLFTSIVALAMVLLIGKELDLPIVRGFILPARADGSGALTIFSLAWLSNICNWLLISGLVGIGMLISGLGSSATNREMSRWYFAVSIIVPCLVFTLLFAPKLGGPIDWDLFCLPISAMVMGSIVLYESDEGKDIPRYLVPLLVLALVNVGGFVAVNASMERSTERFAELIPLSEPKFHWLNWSSLVQHAEKQPELLPRRNEFLMKAWQAPAINKRDSIFTLLKMMETYVMMGDSVSARASLTLLNAIDSVNPNIYSAQAQVLDRFGSGEERVAFAERVQSRFPNDPVALGTAGVIYLRLGLRDKCGELLSRSYALDTNNALTALNYGVFLFNGNRLADAVPILRRALELNRSSFLAAYYLATAYLGLGDIQNAKAATLRAEANALRPEEQERLKQLQAHL